MDVVAQQQVQVLLLAARHPHPDRVELKQQVVAKGASQRQAWVLLVAVLLDHRAQDREDGRLLAALLFGEERGQGLQTSGQRRSFKTQRLPVRVLAQHDVQVPGDDLPARVQRAELQAPPAADDFERRAQRGHVPAGIPFGILIAGGEVDPAMPVQLRKEVAQTTAKGQTR